MHAQSHQSTEITAITINLCVYMYLKAYGMNIVHLS